MNTKRIKELQDELNLLCREATPPAVDHAEAAYVVLKGMEKNTREEFMLLCLDGRRKQIGKPYKVSIGTLTATLVHPREVFREAIKRGANSIVIAHNHPSGDPSPSIEDQNLTTRMVQAGRLLGITVDDHIIVGKQGRFQSLRTLGLMSC